MEGKGQRRRIALRRELLLVEIERRCADPHCDAKARVGLTKEEARAYTGFECERCERWNEDVLTERDVPEWWEELAVTGLSGLRPASRPGEEETGAVIERLSEAWRERERRAGKGPRSAPGDPEGEDS